MRLELSPRLGITSIAANQSIMKLFEARSADELRHSIAKLQMSGWFNICYYQPIPHAWYAIRIPDHTRNAIFESTFLSKAVAAPTWERICAMNRIEKREAKALKNSNNPLEAAKQFPNIRPVKILEFQKV